MSFFVILIASLLLVAMPFVTSSFLLLVMPGATNSVLATSIFHCLVNTLPFKALGSTGIPSFARVAERLGVRSLVSNETGCDTVFDATFGSPGPTTRSKDATSNEGHQLCTLMVQLAKPGLLLPKSMNSASASSRKRELSSVLGSSYLLLVTSLPAT